MIFAVDPNLSSLTVSGDVAGNAFSAQDQAGKSLVTGYNGTIHADVQAASIQFDGGSAVAAIDSGGWAPDANQNAAATAPADYGTRFAGTGLGATRASVLDLTSSQAAAIQSDGTFAAAGTSFRFTAGRIDYVVPGLGKGPEPLTNYSAADVTSSTGHYVVTGGTATLTIPVDVTFLLSAFSTNDTHIRLTGQLVATGDTPATVTDVQVNDGNAQRSMVNSLIVRFDKAVVPETTGAFTIVGRDGAGAGTVVSWTSPVANAIGAAGFWVLTFTGPPIVGGSLADGIYDLTVVGSKIHSTTPDGSTMSGDYTFKFHRLFSDVNGDGVSDNADLFQMRSTYLKPSTDPAYKWYFDYNQDDVVDNADVFQVRSRRSIVFQGY